MTQTFRRGWPGIALEAVRTAPDPKYMRAVLAFVAAAYVLAYFSYWATPGNTPLVHPLGWWGWFDQGEYLKSARALLARDLAPEKHFYPPLYPLLGAAFLPWSSGHPFFLLNLVSLLWFSYAFLRFAQMFVNRHLATAILLATVILDRTIFENFVIPWTSTLTAALLGTGLLGFVWIRDAQRPSSMPIGLARVLLVALSLGMVVATRPIDGLPAALLGLGVLFAYLTCPADRRPGLAPTGAVAVVAYLAGPVLFFSFNFLSYGSALGRYFGAATGNGYHPADLAEKFVSLWLDGYPLYAEANAGLVQHYPWLLLALGALAWALLRAAPPLRWCAIAITALYAVYLPYGDLLPNSLWRYKNVHYFKWTFPLLALMLATLGANSWREWRQKRRYAGPVFFLLLIPVVLLSVRLGLEYAPAEAATTGKEPAIELRFAPREVDFADLKHVKGGFVETYFGQHRVWVDGRELGQVRDFRLLPVPGGTRLVLIRPVVTGSIRIQSDQRLSWSKTPEAYVGSYRFVLDWPWSRSTAGSLPENYELGHPIDFSAAGDSGDYAIEGWANPEAWGRWSTGKRAGIRMKVPETGRGKLILQARIGAFTPGTHCQHVAVVVNRTPVGQLDLCGIEGTDIESARRFIVPEAALAGANRDLRIEFLTPDAISPKDAQASDDERVLGVAIRSLSLNRAP